MARANRRPLCADLSRDAAEPLSATASRVEHWLLVEHRGPWARDLLAASSLPPGAKERVAAELAGRRFSRLVFVRRPGRGRRGFRVFYAHSGERERQLVSWEVESYTDLTHLDLAGGAPVDHPLFLVCTHGKRDRCCAVYGSPLYASMAEAVEPESLWQCSHVGGDRFAGNVVVLPDGVYYGRVTDGDVEAIVARRLAGELHLPSYRGRSCHSFPEQAAEGHVRERTGALGLDDVAVVESRRADGGWLVVIEADRLYEVEVADERGELTYLTCDSPALARPRRFRATSLRPLR
jgi:hypothetical protein